MTPAVVSGISGESNLEKHIERQMGCMAGFLQLFYRQQIFSRKRLYSANRLPNSPAVGFPSPLPECCPSSPEIDLLVVPSYPLQLPVFDVKDGRKTPWKLREAPRLSLDSRAFVDARGKLLPAEIRTTPACFPGEHSDFSKSREDQRRSPSIVARLMGLEALPSVGIEEPEQTTRAVLRRSASESRVTRDFSQQKLSPIPTAELFRRRKEVCSEIRAGDPKLDPPGGSPSRKGYIVQELFPDPKKTRSIYDEIEKRLRMRGIKEPAKDIGTLKQILETLHLDQGILQTKPPVLQAAGDSPIVGIKSAAKLPSLRTASSETPLLHHRSTSPRRPMPSDSTIPVRAESSRSPISSRMRRRSANVEEERASQPRQRIPTVHSPRPTPKCPVSDKMGHQPPTPGRPKARISSNVIPYQPAEDYTSSSDNCILRSPSQSDFQRARMEERKTGRFLLERCGKLLHSIEAITNSSSEMETAADPQPSPVSVLDSSFLSEESSAKPERSIVFKEWEHNASPTADAFSGARALSGDESSPVRWLRKRSEGVIGLTSKEWAVPWREMSDAVLYMERLIFKDMMADTIQELSVLACRRGPTSLPRRRLIF